ncbi:MAG: hypothetical protein DMF71_15280 [Acidobacteria bacterium]|nr:MAG: hypothetical protein DMF71_15280 [Acidobacteriota bacterium]
MISAARHKLFLITIDSTKWLFKYERHHNNRKAVASAKPRIGWCPNLQNDGYAVSTESGSDRVTADCEN